MPVAVRGGDQREQERLDALRQRHGIPVMSGVRACVEAFRHLGVERPLVMTAYLDEMNAQLPSYVAAAGGCWRADNMPRRAGDWSGP